MDDRVLMRSLREQGFKVRFTPKGGRKGRSGSYLVTAPNGNTATLPEKIYGRHNRADPGAVSRLKQLGAKMPEEWKAHQESQPKQREENGMTTSPPAEAEAPITPGTMGADPGISLDGAAGESRPMVEEDIPVTDVDQELADFGSWIREHRKTAGISQRQLGEMGGLEGATAQSMVSRVEKGGGTVQSALLVKLCAGLKVDPADSRRRLARYELVREAAAERRRVRASEGSRRARSGEPKPAPEPKTQPHTEPAKAATSSTPAAGPVTVRHQAPSNPAARARQLLAKLDGIPEIVAELKGLIEPIADENVKLRANHKKLEEILGKAIDIV